MPEVLPEIRVILAVFPVKVPVYAGSITGNPGQNIGRTKISVVVCCHDTEHDDKDCDLLGDSHRKCGVQDNSLVYDAL